MERDLTTGSIGRNILKFSLPYFLSYFLQTLYGMATARILRQKNERMVLLFDEKILEDYTYEIRI